MSTNLRINYEENGLNYPKKFQINDRQLIKITKTKYDWNLALNYFKLPIYILIFRENFAFPFWINNI